MSRKADKRVVCLGVHVSLKLLQSNDDTVLDLRRPPQLIVITLQIFILLN